MRSINLILSIADACFAAWVFSVHVLPVTLIVTLILIVPCGIFYVVAGGESVVITMICAFVGLALLARWRTRRDDEDEDAYFAPSERLVPNGSSCIRVCDGPSQYEMDMAEWEQIIAECRDLPPPVSAPEKPNGPLRSGA